MTASDPIQRLFELRRVRTEAEADEFHAIANALYGISDEASLRRILPVFYDHVAIGDAMDILERVVGRFPADVLVKVFIDAVPGMMNEAAGWCGEILNRLLQDAAARRLLERAIAGLEPPARDALRVLLAELEDVGGPAAPDARRIREAL